MTAIPPSHQDLLERPLFGHLATIRPDGTAQSNPVWYVWDGETLKFSFSTKQQKHRNVESNPSVALSIHDPDEPYRYLEVRGVIDTVEPDPDGGTFFMRLNSRYNGPFTESIYPAYGAIYTMRPTATSKQG